MAESLNEILLIMVISSWLNVALYTLELVLCARYFARPSRPFIHKIGVACLVLADTACTVVVNLDVGFAVQRLPPKNLRLLFAPLATEIMATYVSAVISQLFLCNLFYVLTGKRIVAGGILVLIFVHLGFSWASAFIIIRTLNPAGMAFTTTTVGAVSCAATDFIVAGSLAWKFWRMMAVTQRENSIKSTLRRILILSVSSGAICASNTLTMMILLLKGSEVFQFFFACQGRVYALTILGNFLVGIPARQQVEMGASQRLATSFSNSIVVFRSMAVETSVSPSPGPKSPERLRLSPTSATSLPYLTRESLQLDDLPLEPRQERIHIGRSHCT
ncbi:hypothetical protein B0H19DRAFT_383485 [Mycena capillaripes]|nr:hypothetical protein B0H19DRAFT_383485 [Mycena capillaripes]